MGFFILMNLYIENKVFLLKRNYYDVIFDVHKNSSRGNDMLCAWLINNRSKWLAAIQFGVLLF